MRRRLERGEPVAGTVTLARATPEQRDAVARLLGRRPRDGATVSVRLEDLDAVLRRSGVHPDGLAAGVVALTGPVRDRRTAEAKAEAAWAAAFGRLDPAVDAHPELEAWAGGLRSTGTVRRVSRDPVTAATLLGRLAAVLAALPADAEPVGRFAERILGSAHALDADRPLSGLAFGAARVLGRVGDGDGAAWRRDVWASVGLLRDELSSTVLVLNLPVATDTPTGRMLAGLRATGEPAVLTLRQLRRPPRLHCRGTVSICENPVVVAEAADRLGAAAGPLVCIGGQPGVAAMTVLRSLAEGGARLRYHGDFDWGGLRIGNVVFGRLPVEPWRFDAAAYRSATAHGAGRPLSAEPIACAWDPELAEEMRRTGRAVEEERVVDDLLADLAQPLDPDRSSG
ncbi:TIGR02679 family protein [Pseudonocardia sp. DLS-67]